jgi:hypothetical protein
LQLSKSQAAPGEEIGVTGDGYARCTDVDSQVTWVRLLGDGDRLADVTGLGGKFSTQVTVPQDASEGIYTVAAECEGTSVILASSDLTVTKPNGGGTNSGPGGGTNSGPGGGTNSGPGGGSDQGQANGSSGQPSTGRWTPVALVSSTGGGLALVTLFALWAFTSHVRRGRHDFQWVKEHLRAVAGSSPGPPSAEIRHRPGVMSVSLGLEPHDDHFGNQTIKGVAR